MFLNSLAHGKFEWNFRHVIFKKILVIDDWGISYEIALIWMSLDVADDQSTLVQVMAWCRQATSHYLSQCWPRSLSPFGDTRPQWVNVEIIPLPILNNLYPSLPSFDISWCRQHSSHHLQGQQLQVISCCLWHAAVGLALIWNQARWNTVSMSKDLLTSNIMWKTFLHIFSTNLHVYVIT